jgi:hypothetical protein
VRGRYTARPRNDPRDVPPRSVGRVKASADRAERRLGVRSSWRTGHLPGCRSSLWCELAADSPPGVGRPGGPPPRPVLQPSPVSSRSPATRYWRLHRASRPADAIAGRPRPRTTTNSPDLSHCRAPSRKPRPTCWRDEGRVTRQQTSGASAYRHFYSEQYTPITTPGRSLR